MALITRGSLQVERPDTKRASQRLLTCTHTASGHTSAVLSMFATQSYLFSASQGEPHTLHTPTHPPTPHTHTTAVDRSVKVWNLKTGTELLSLDKHFSYVRSVTFCPRTSLIFTASQSLIKVRPHTHTHPLHPHTLHTHTHITPLYRSGTCVITGRAVSRRLVPLVAVERVWCRTS